MATNMRISYCHECGKSFTTLYQCGWGYEIRTDGDLCQFCSYTCKRAFEKRQKPLRKDERQRKRIEMELRGIL